MSFNSGAFIANELMIPHFVLVRHVSSDAFREVFPRSPGKIGKIGGQEFFSDTFIICPKIRVPPFYKIRSTYFEYILQEYVAIRIKFHTIIKISPSNIHHQS